MLYYITLYTMCFFFVSFILYYIILCHTILHYITLYTTDTFFQKHLDRQRPEQGVYDEQSDIDDDDDDYDEIVEGTFFLFCLFYTIYILYYIL